MTAATSAAYGHGPRKVIVMNGWLGVARHWTPLLEALDPARFQVVVFEYRGYGARRDVGGPHTFEAAAQDVLSLADTLGWDRFSLVGHSMGGMAMQRVALAAQQRVCALVGLAPVSAAGSGMDAARLALFERAVHDDEARAAVLHASTGQRLTPTWSARCAREAQENAPEAMAAYLRAWTGGGFSDQVAGLRLPVQVIVGEHDPGINAAMAARTWQQHYPQAQVAVMPNTGHYPMLEAPLATAACVQGWLLEQEAGCTR